MAGRTPSITDPSPVRLPIIPKDAKFRRFAWDWVTPEGDRWDHKGNPLGKSAMWEYRNDKAHAAAKK